MTDEVGSLMMEVGHVLAQFPSDMIHAEAARVRAKLTDRDAALLIASYELHKPRVHERTVTDAVRVREFFGGA